jgi:hypothetical protein
MARCSKNRMGNGSNGWLTPSRRRTRGCQTAWWRLECEVAVANERVGRILLATGSQKGNSGSASNRRAYGVPSKGIYVFCSALGTPHSPARKSSNRRRAMSFAARHQPLGSKSKEISTATVATAPMIRCAGSQARSRFSSHRARDSQARRGTRADQGAGVRRLPQRSVCQRRPLAGYLVSALDSI